MTPEIFQQLKEISTERINTILKFWMGLSYHTQNDEFFICYLIDEKLKRMEEEC